MITRDAEADEQERAEVSEQRNWILIRERKQQEHERLMKQIEVDGDITVKKLEAELAKAQGVAREKIISRRAIWLGIIKLPAIPFAVLFCYILEQTGHDIPEALDNFLVL